ncbi:MAG: hypothetical protein ACTHM5_11975, partial [Ginsengibacter sp.]
MFTFLVTLKFGQYVKKATNYLNDKKYDKAKSEIEGILAKDPNSLPGLYLKSKLITSMADSSAFKGQLPPNPYEEAFDAFKKAMADSTNSAVTLMVIKDNYAPIFKVYSGIYGEAADAFNNAANSANKPDT